MAYMIVYLYVCMYNRQYTETHKSQLYTNLYNTAQHNTIQHATLHSSHIHMCLGAWMRVEVGVHMYIYMHVCIFIDIYDRPNKTYIAFFKALTTLFLAIFSRPVITVLNNSLEKYMVAALYTNQRTKPKELLDTHKKKTPEKQFLKLLSEMLFIKKMYFTKRHL